MVWRVKKPAIVPACFVQPCLGIDVAKVPTAPGWIHELKHDGYRMQIRKDGDRVRLFTRRGFDWTKRYPRIIAAALAIKANTCSIDGEAVCLDENGLAVFSKLHSRCFETEVIFYAFDVMELAGEDLKALPLIERKKRLARLVSAKGVRAGRKPVDGVHLVEHDVQDGPGLFRAACAFGAEGIVSKRATSRYMPGPRRCEAWVKTKNKAAPGCTRVRDGMEG